MGPKIFLEKHLILIPEEFDLETLQQQVSNILKISKDEFYFTYNGKIICSENQICSNNPNIYINIRVLGGKGGFGSMLRAIGAQIEKTTNKEACRDLNGRRLRDINQEKKLKAWLEKEKDREKEAKERKKKKLEKLIATPKHEFKDKDYEHARSELVEKVSDAVEEGFKKAQQASAIKRKNETVNKQPLKKKPGLWIGDDLSSDSSEDTDSDDDVSNKNDKVSNNSNSSSQSPCCSKSLDTESSNSADSGLEKKSSSAGSISNQSNDKTESDNINIESKEEHSLKEDKNN